MVTKHGISGYNNDGCRCDICRLAKNAYMIEYRKKRKFWLEIEKYGEKLAPPEYVE